MIDENSFKKKIVAQKNEENDNYFKSLIYKTFIKCLIVIILFLGALIYIKQSDAARENFKKIVYNNSLSFAKIYNIYQKYLGDVIPFKNIYKDNTKLVSEDKITYSNITKENNGYILDVMETYLVSSIKSGIIIKIEESSDYKTMITIQDKDGLNITYGFLSDLNVKLYDYVEKGEVLANANKKLYLSFEKDGKYLSYEEYL